jgi:hypothetical protein
VTFVVPPPNAFYTDTVDAAFGFTRDDDPATYVWTDITKYVRGGITITKAKPDATSTADPTHIQLTLDNTDGRFTKGNPLSPYWPNVVRGVPIRVRRAWKNSTTSYERAVGFVAGWPQDPQAGLLNVLTQIDAYGRLRWLRRDNTPVGSALFHTLSRSSPTAYWPLEDGSDATGAGSLVSGVRPMRVSGSVAFGQSGVGGTAAYVDLNGGGSLSSSLSGGTATDHWGVLAGFEIQDTTPTRSAFPLFWSTSSGVACLLLFSFLGAGTGTALEVNIAGPGIVAGSGYLLSSFYDPLTWQPGTFHTVISYTYTISAGVFNMGFIIDGVDTGTIFSGSGDVTANPGALRRFVVNPGASEFALFSALFDPSVVSQAQGVAHVAAWQPFNPATTVTIGDASDGYNGESATTRIARLGAQNSIPVVTSAGTLGAPQPLGPQPVGSLGDILDAAADADCGLLHDGGALGGLYYASPGARYNAATQLTVAYPLGQISDGLAGTDDDQQLTNDVTISRTGGSSGRWTNTTSTAIEGQIGTGDTLNLHDDQQPDKVAQLRANLSSFDAMRVPFLPIDLRRNPELAEKVTGLTLPAYIAVNSVPSPFPPFSIDQFAEGWTETLDVDTWRIVFNCAPAAPWRVGVLDDATNPLRWDADSLLVNAGVSATATSVGLKTTAGPLVTTSGADFPVLIYAPNTGEVMRLTNCTGASSPQTGTIVRAVNGVAKALATNDPIVLYRPPTLAL